MLGAKVEVDHHQPHLLMLHRLIQAILLLIQDPKNVLYIIKQVLMDNTSTSDISGIRNVLKYNGHDYITVQTPESGAGINIDQIEIQHSGKGAAKVFLAVDCSRVMRDTQVTVNGVTKSRLQVATDAAKELVDALINSGENIYVGLVFFSGTSYRAVSLTKDTEILYQALDDIVANGWEFPNTNIVGALDKVMESYYNNDELNSNRYLAILSDGIPTSDGEAEDVEKAQELSSKTWMRVVGGT